MREPIRNRSKNCTALSLLARERCDECPPKFSANLDADDRTMLVKAGKLAYLWPVTAPTLKLLLFAGLKQQLKTSCVDLVWRPGLNVRALKAELYALAPTPELEKLLERCRVAVNQEFIEDDAQILPDAVEIAVIPPVSGGIDIDEDGIEESAGDELPFRGRRSYLTDASLVVSDVLAEVSHPGAGGINVFIGNVRQQSRGRQVTHLEYEAYPGMAVRVMDKIAKSIESSISGSRIAIYHRVGRLEIGETAVIIAASAPHRAEAFDACRRAIEALKEDVPIWKKEFDPSGGVWIGQGP